MKCNKFIPIILTILQLSLFSQSMDNGLQFHTYKDSTYAYAKPAFTDPFKFTVADYKMAFRDMWSKDNIFPFLLVTGSTLILIKYDQDLIEAAQRLGNELNISSKDNTTTFLSIGDLAIFRGPTDVGSTMYFFGDGWFHGSIMASFLGYGLYAGDNRALQTGSQLVEGLITTGIATQLIKHITGRQSPIRSTTDGGEWDFFPDQIEYHKHVPSYDAFPSGHLATAMMTYTVITENYPEYNSWVKPLGWTLMILTSYQMMNNEVHWASDYPLAIVIGYYFGKVAADRGKIKMPHDENTGSLNIGPAFFENSYGIKISYKF